MVVDSMPVNEICNHGQKISRLSNFSRAYLFYIRNRSRLLSPEASKSLETRKRKSLETKNC